MAILTKFILSMGRDRRSKKGVVNIEGEGCCPRVFEGD
jgi:hypothetical protein